MTFVQLRLYAQCHCRNLFNVNPITDNPDFKLQEFLLPALLERFHPGPIFLLIRHVIEDASEIVAINDAGLLPAAFDDLSFVTDGAESVANCQNTRQV